MTVQPRWTAAPPPPTGAADETRLAGLGVLLQLEKEARGAASAGELGFLMVNETARLLTYRQAALLGRRGGSRWRVEALSGAALLDRRGPYAQWLGRLARHAPADDSARPLTVADVPPAVASDWAEWLPPHVLWLPLVAPGGRRLGVLALARAQPWQPAEALLADRLAEAYAHAWLTLQLGPSRWRPAGAGGRLARVGGAVAVAAAAAAMVAMPVRLSALAPVEVAPQDPVVVAAPAEGVIAEIPVRPNQAVAAGDILFRLDDTSVRNRHAVAERTLKVAEAELQQATKKAFQDADSSARVAVLRARAEERRAELAYLAELLGRLRVHAERAGVVVLRDANEWLGRPVRIGERVLLLADPAQVRLTAWLPVDGAIPIAPGAAMQAFLNVDPLAPLAAVVERQSYEAEVTPQGVLAHRVEARLADGTPSPQIGLKGTAKLYGDEVSLGYYLLRAPLAALRRLVAF